MNLSARVALPLVLAVACTTTRSKVPEGDPADCRIARIEILGPN